LTRQIKVDLAKYPFLAANVTELISYAHMDVDVLVSAGKVLKTIRSSTIQAGGVALVNLRESLFPAEYTLQLRLIVVGSKDGCWATYNRICLTSQEDGNRLNDHPNLHPNKMHSGLED
jgi:hypothetical protein